MITSGNLVLCRASARGIDYLGVEPVSWQLYSVSENVLFATAVEHSKTDAFSKVKSPFEAWIPPE